MQGSGEPREGEGEPRGQLRCRGGWVRGCERSSEPARDAGVAGRQLVGSAVAVLGAEVFLKAPPDLRVSQSSVNPARVDLSAV